MVLVHTEKLLFKYITSNKVHVELDIRIDSFSAFQNNLTSLIQRPASYTAVIFNSNNNDNQ